VFTADTGYPAPVGGGAHAVGNPAAAISPATLPRCLVIATKCLTTPGAR
jgi:hypothetical protein